MPSPPPPGNHPKSPDFLKDASAQAPILGELWQGSPMGILLIVPGTDVKHPILIGDCNPVVCQTHGYTRDELVGQSLDLLHAVPWTPTVDSDWFSAPKNGDTIRGTALHRRKDDSHVMVEYTLFFTEINGVRCAIGFDKVAEKRSEEQDWLHEVTNRWINAMESSEEGIWEIEKGQIWTSPRWQRILGRPQREEIQSLSNLYRDIHPDDRKRLARSIDSIFADKNNALTFEGRIRNIKGKWIWIALRGKVSYAADGSPHKALGSMTNISERKRVEEELQRSREKAEEASRSKSQFLAAMSHEIRTPMNGVLGMASLLSDTNLDEDQKSFLETIKNSGDSLLSIIDEILSFSKLEAGGVELERHPFDIEVCLYQAFEVIRPLAAPQHLDLHYSVQPDIPREVLGDSAKIRQIAVNILGNAVKFTQKGAIELSLSATPAKASDTGTPRFQFKFAVKDSGIGIKPENVDKLFEPFCQADASTTREFGGTGLGLAISRRLASLMDGSIEVESEYGRGSTFTCDVLLETPLKPTAPEAPTLSKKRTLLIGPANRTKEILSDFLKSHGFQVFPVEDPEQSLAALQSQPRFDCAFIDFESDFDKANTLATRINAALSRSKLPLIRLDSFESYQSYDFAKHGFKAQLVKPFAPFQLRRILAETLNPAKKQKDESPKEAAPRRTPSYPENVLIVEDNPVNQLVAARLISKFGYDSDIAEDGYAALELCARNHYDIIFMDIQMPGINGLETHEKLQGRLAPSTRKPWVIALTAWAMEKDKENCIRAGMDDFLAKPIRPETLEGALQRAREYLDSRD